MTDIVNPSFNRPADSFFLSGTIAGLGVNDYIVKSADSPTEMAQDAGLDGSNLNAFDQNSSSSSFNVTIEGGEAFVYGSWVARDTQTTITLDSDTNDQVVYLGWEKQNSDNVVIGKVSAFNSDWPKTELYSFDTDLNGVIQ